MSNDDSGQETYQIHPIGYVRRSSADEGSILLEILEPYRAGLKLLDHFSQVIVFFRADRFDNDEDRNNMTTHPPYAQERLTGVFACRAPYRPNPILTTICRILAVDEEMGVVKVANIDALPDSPIIDLKSYFPASDRVKDAKIPDWLVDWPEWLPDDGLEL